MLSDSDGAEIASDIRTDYASKLEQVRFNYTNFTFGSVFPMCW